MCIDPELENNAAEMSSLPSSKTEIDIGILFAYSIQNTHTINNN